MRIAVGCDHAGFALKQDVLRLLADLGHEIRDVGAFDATASDYPDYSKKVGLEVASGRCERGILVCGSGVGASVAANKVPGVRAALCHDTFSGRQGVEDDDLNVVCLGARVIGPALAAEVVRVFLAARFSGAERHLRRLNKVKAIERDALHGVLEEGRVP